MKNARITIIGLGRVGQALLKILSEHGFEIISAYNRSNVSNQLKKSFSGTHFFTGTDFSELEFGDWIFITVSDDAIPKMVQELTQLQDAFDGKTVVHCSGTLTSQVLEPLRQKGAETASFHPLQSITPTTTNFTDTWFDIEGHQRALNILDELANTLGAKTLRVKPEAKPFLHAAAVAASNYVVVLADLVTKIAAQGEISEQTALQALTPLMENTIQNIKELGVADALTGPVARGDIKTIQTHLITLKDNPEALSIYKILGREAVKISEAKHGASQSLTTINTLLS